MAQDRNPEFVVYRDLRRKILTGELKDGDRLVETALAAEYHVSRLHIKSALRLLEQEQLAEHIRMCGFQVKGFTEESMEEIEELRLALDRVTFMRFARTALPEDIANLRKRARRIAAFFQTDMEEDANEEVDDFYSFVYKRSGYIHITAILDKYSDYFKIIRRQSSGDANLNKEAVQLLFQIVDAIEEKDLEALSERLGQR